MCVRSGATIPAGLHQPDAAANRRRNATTGLRYLMLRAISGVGFSPSRQHRRYGGRFAGHAPIAATANEADISPGLPSWALTQRPSFPEREAWWSCPTILRGRSVVDLTKRNS